MKYIPVLNEKWYTDMLSDYEEAFQTLFNKLYKYNTSFHPLEGALVPTPVQKDGKIFPFPLAAELESIFLWLIGQAERPQNLEEIMNDILQLVWQNPFVDSTELLDVSWDRWTGILGSYTGQFYRFAQIALKIENKDTLNASDLSIISGLSAAAIGKQIREGKIKAEKTATGWVISSEESKRWIGNQNLKYV